MFGFDDPSKNLDEILEESSTPETDLKFGITFLDDAFGGIQADDLVIVTARTGAGKTELATQLAYHNSIKEKRTHLFALEAYKGEIERRLTFRKIAERFFLAISKNYYGDLPNFQDWQLKKQEFLKPFQPEAIAQLKNELKTLRIFYREQNFDVETFEAKLAMISSETQLVIVDHLHYFDLDSSDENQDLKRTVKKIRDLTLFYRKPTVLVAHIRKQDKRFQSIVPDIEDIYGSSDISKVATKIFAAAPATNINQDEQRPHIYPTYLRILKNRMDGSRAYYTAICKFNIQENRYEKEYCLGKIKGDGTFEECKKVPSWAKHHRSILSGSSSGQRNTGYNSSDR